jgi:hypothetical protein
MDKLELIPEYIWTALNREFDCVLVPAGHTIDNSQSVDIGYEVSVSFEHAKEHKEFLVKAVENWIIKLQNKIKELGFKKGDTVFFREGPSIWTDPTVTKIRHIGFYGWVEVFYHVE